MADERSRALAVRAHDELHLAERLVQMGFGFDEPLWWKQGAASTGLLLSEEACATGGESSTGHVCERDKDAHRITAVVEVGAGDVSLVEKGEFL